MTRITTVQTSLSSGEIDPKLRAQTSLKAYNEGAFKLRNLALIATGGAERRPGTMDLAALPAKTRLLDYDFSPTQRYVLALYAGGLKIFGIDGTLYQTIGSAPWTLDNLFELSYTYSGDVTFLTHTSFFVRLVRTGATTFTLENFAFLHSADDLKIYQPYYKFAADDVTIEPSAATGTVNLVASTAAGWDGFVAAHVGARFRIMNVEVQIATVTNTTHATAAVKGALKGTFDNDPFKSSAGSGTVEVLHPFHGFATGESIQLAGSNILGAADDGTGGIPSANLSGSFTITVIDENRYTIVASGAATAAVGEDGGGPSVTFTVAAVECRDWLEPAISAVRGYPATCCFHEQRLWLAGTPSSPDGYWSSDSLKPYRFDVGTGLDGQSVQGAAGIENISSIRHLISNQDLQIFTPTAEGVFVTRQGEPITPAAQRVVSNSGAGCSFVMPRVFDGATLFVQENGLSVSEYLFSDQLGRNIATPISMIAGHLLKTGIVDSAVSTGTVSRAEQYAFFPVGDGSLAAFHSMRAENVAGWMMWILGGGALVESVSASGNDIFLAVLRGAERRLYKIEASEQFYALDGAVEHLAEDGPKTDWTLDARVRGRWLAVSSELGFHGMFAIPLDGEFEAPLACERLLVGDPYFYLLETVTPRVQFANGERDRLAKRIIRAIVEFDETASAVIDGSPIVFRPTGEDPSIAPEPFTGAYEFRLLGYSRNPTITISQQEPVFARILGMTLEVAA